MGKLLFWLVVFLVAGIFLALRVRLRERKASRLNRDPKNTTMQSVRCRECGIFLPEQSAVRRDGEDFCSWEHAEKWHKRQQG